MYFGLSDEAVAFRDGLRDVLTKHCSPKVIRAAWQGDSGEALWQKVGEFGLLGMLIPEGRGGLGLDELAFVAAMEEAGWHGMPGPVMETVVCAPVLDLPTDGSARITVFREAKLPWSRSSTHALLDNGPPELLELGSAQLRPLRSVDGARQLAENPGHGSRVMVDVPTWGADVVTRGEVLARTRQDDDLHLVVVRRPVVGIVQRIGHLGVLRVAILLAVHRHDRNGAPHLVANGRFFAHRAVLSRRALATFARCCSVVPQSLTSAQVRLVNRWRSYSVV